MKLIYNINADGVVKFEIEDEDDVFVLYQLLELGCEVTCSTYRKVTRTAQTGTVITDKVKVTLGVKVERVEFGDVLGITGIIVYSNSSKVQTGRYHTLRITTKDVVSIKKDKWDELDRNRIKEASDERIKTTLVVLGVDGGTAKLWYVSNTFVKEKEGLEISIPKKRKIVGKHESQTDLFYSRLYDMVVNNVDFDHINAFILAGTFTERAKALKELQKNATKHNNVFVLHGLERTVQVSATNGVSFAIRDVLSDPNLATILDDCKSYNDMASVIRFNEAMLKNEHSVAIGYDDVIEAHEQLAIKELFIADEMSKLCGIEKRLAISNIIEELKASNVVVKVISSKTEAGCEVMRLGGVVGILRYDLVLGNDDGEFAEDYNSDDIDWFGRNVPTAIGDEVEGEGEE
ncbi:Pelota protein [Entamoeba marina]